MGEYADMALEVAVESDWCGFRSPRVSRPKRCKHCGFTGLFWGWHEEGWRLFDGVGPGRVLHSCLAAQGTPTRRAETTGSVGEADGGPVAASNAPERNPR